MSIIQNRSGTKVCVQNSNGNQGKCRKTKIYKRHIIKLKIRGLVQISVTFVVEVQYIANYTQHKEKKKNKTDLSECVVHVVN